MSKLTVNENNLCSLGKEFLVSRILLNAHNDPVFYRKLEHDLFIKYDPYGLGEFIRERCQSCPDPEDLQEEWESYGDELISEDLIDEFKQYISWIPELEAIDPDNAGEVVFDLIRFALRIEDHVKEVAPERLTAKNTAPINEVISALTEHWVGLLTSHELSPETFVDNFLSLPEYGHALCDSLTELGEEFLSSETFKLLVQRLSEIIAAMRAGDVEHTKDLLGQLNKMYALLLISRPGGPEEYLESFIKEWGSRDGVIKGVCDLFDLGGSIVVDKILPSRHYLPLEMNNPNYSTYKKYIDVLFDIGRYREAVGLHYELVKACPTDEAVEELGDLIKDVSYNISRHHATFVKIMGDLKEKCLEDSLPLSLVLSLWADFSREMGGAKYFNYLIALRQSCVRKTSVSVWEYILGLDRPPRKGEGFKGRPYKKECQVGWYLIQRQIVSAMALSWPDSPQGRPENYYNYAASRIRDARRFYDEISPEELRVFKLGGPEKWVSDLRSSCPEFMELVEKPVKRMRVSDEVKISSMQEELPYFSVASPDVQILWEGVETDDSDNRNSRNISNGSKYADLLAIIKAFNS